MYHCGVNFYFMGRLNETIEIIKTIPSPKNFSYTFSHDLIIPTTSHIEKADVIFADFTSDSESVDISMIKTIISSKRADTQLIVLTDKENFLLLNDFLPEITDIWLYPLSGEELRFRFLKWQSHYKMSKDYWQTNQYLESTINSIPNLIWYKDKNGIHCKVNDSFCKTVNKTKQQVEGREHFYIWDVDPNDPENEGHDCMKSDMEVMVQKQTIVSEEYVKSGDDMKLLTTFKSPLYDLDGSVMGTVGVGIDITRERAYEQEITRKNLMMETIFSAVDCGILCHSIDGLKILSVNKTALKLLGYDSSDELLADGFDIIANSVMDEDKPILRNAIKTLKEEGDSASVEYRVQHKDGEILHIMGNIKLLKENGELFYQRFLLDCTDQKLQEKEKERRQSELVQALSIDYSIVWSFNLDTGLGITLRYDNTYDDAFSSNNELSFNESMERYIQLFVYKDDREMLHEILNLERLKKELTKKQLYYTNYRALKNDEIQYYEIKAVRTGTWEKKHNIVLGIRNVDEETRNEMQQKKLLENALLQANAANKAKSIFLSNMSHDIRTPMNAIMGFTNLAVMHIDRREQVEDYLKKIMSSGNHLLSLINNVLDMSQIESGKIQIEETLCSLSDILHNIKNIIYTHLQEKRLEFHIETANIINDNIYCDKLRLNQALLNIISNSIKYTNEGGKITLKISEKAGTIHGFSDYEFCITDNGIGMSEDFLSHIYELFARERNTTNSGIQGTGLGMAITKNIIDTMNGTIDVKSQKGIGTEVIIRLPLRFDMEIKETAPESSQNTGESEITVNNKSDSVTKRILLVEDNELNQEIAEEILSSNGFEVEIADNGKIAVDMLKNSVPKYYSLILMDIQMPVMNGYEAAKTIRSLENKKLASIPIFAMTANAFEEDKQNALKCGMNGHIAKPIDIAKLISLLNKFFYDK
ncbi:MAG: response regulator [Ruminococcus sp.]|nr:response regulator [Ruminococcus sp.]